MYNAHLNLNLIIWILVLSRYKLFSKFSLQGSVQDQNYNSILDFQQIHPQDTATPNFTLLDTFLYNTENGTFFSKNGVFLFLSKNCEIVTCSKFNYNEFRMYLN